MRLINKKKYSKNIIDELEKEIIPSKEKIMSYILDFNKDISFLGLLMLRTQFEKIYKRPYVLEFFTSKNIHKRYNNEIHQLGLKNLLIIKKVKHIKESKFLYQKKN